MRTYGQLSYSAAHKQLLTDGRELRRDAAWVIQAEPHVMMRLKGVFSKLDKYQFGEVKVKHSAEVCRDLEWFMDRYPLRMSIDDEQFLTKQSRLHEQTLRDLNAMMVNYTPSFTGLALPAREYQSLAVEIYWKRRMLLLADQLGLGKSITAIASLTRPDSLPAAVICQTHLQSQWEGYFQTFLPGARTHVIKKTQPYALPGADVFILTYHKLHGWVDTFRDLYPVRSLIFDECQELRHPDSGKYRSAKALRESAQFTMGLSATPIYNYGGEIFNVMEIIAPGMLGTESEFQREWCINRGKHALLREPDAFGAYLREQFLMLRRTRKEVGRELPPVETIVESVEFKQECLDSIDTLATELAHRILKGSFHEQGEAAREFDMRLRQVTGIAKAPYVAAFVQMLVEDGQSVLLTGWHREVYDIWQSHLNEAKINSVLYTGTESPRAKEYSREEFVSGRAPVMMMSLRSGAGLDGLQEKCSTIVHGELDWSPGVHEQCRGRLFRDGQSQSVAEFYLVSAGGSDPIVADVLGLKTAQVHGMLDPDSKGIQKLQTDVTSRVKRMAEAYLRRKGKQS